MQIALTDVEDAESMSSPCDPPASSTREAAPPPPPPPTTEDGSAATLLLPVATFSLGNTSVAPNGSSSNLPPKSLLLLAMSALSISSSLAESSREPHSAAFALLKGGRSSLVHT